MTFGVLLCFIVIFIGPVVVLLIVRLRHVIRDTRAAFQEGVREGMRRRSSNNFILIAKNITYIREILHDEYEECFPNEDTLLMTCGIIDTLSYAFAIEDMKLAVLLSKTGKCSLELAYHKQVFEAQEVLLGHDQFLNFVLQLEAMMFLEDNPHRPQNILNAVVSQKMNIKRAIESAKQSFASGNRPTELLLIVSNFMDSDTFEKVRKELGLISFGHSRVTTHCPV